MRTIKKEDLGRLWYEKSGSQRYKGNATFKNVAHSHKLDLLMHPGP
jgi:hypothetical protein